MFFARHIHESRIVLNLLTFNVVVEFLLKQNIKEGKTILLATYVYVLLVQYDSKFPMKLDVLKYCRQTNPTAENIRRDVRQGPLYRIYKINNFFFYYMLTKQFFPLYVSIACASTPIFYMNIFFIFIDKINSVYIHIYTNIFIFLCTLNVWSIYFSLNSR